MMDSAGPILDLIGEDTRLRRVAATGGGEWAGPCPFCGGRDRFRVWPERGRYWCRRCEISGDAINYLRNRDGLGYRDACRRLGRDPTRRRPQRPASPAPRELRTPSARWRVQGEALAQRAETTLWEPRGERALDYLRRRGLQVATIREARLGYHTVDQYDEPNAWGLPSDHKPVWVPRGVVIPWRVAGALWRVNIRRPAGTPKYIGPAASGKALYGVDDIASDKAVVLVEGEFDALVVAQQGGDLVVAVATGSTHGGRHWQWAGKLALAPLVLVAFDADEPGEQGARWWLNVLPNGKRWRPYWDDVSQIHEDGADVREWVVNGLADNM